jgi:hypothetical protein
MMKASEHNIALSCPIVVKASLVQHLPHAPEQGCIATDQRIESVGLFLASFAGMRGIAGTPGTVEEKGKSLEKQKIAVS